MKAKNAIVSVVMGSDTDLPVMLQCLKALERFGLPAEVLISSAHRLPEETATFAKNAAGRGIKVIVAGAGWAAHLAGMIAAFTPLPVIAVPLSGSALNGVDALYATVQMPKGVPVATVAVDGAYNAGVLAAQIIGVGDPSIREKVQQYKLELAEQVRDKNFELQKLGYEAYLQSKK
ncbi:MAG: 5-(carboxyamino)imidazole ribonucleotide mutase [Dethiobacteria bacterium]|jgi:5-(carboxyamino)imidazole ribonucleotide mutase